MIEEVAGCYQDNTNEREWIQKDAVTSLWSHENRRALMHNEIQSKQK